MEQEQEIDDDEVLSDSQSTSTTRPSSSSSTDSDMPKANLQSHRESFSKRQSTNIDVNGLNKQLKDQTPIKVLVFNGKCSKIFKSVLEDCVEDCILEFPDETNLIYVPKSGHAIPIPAGSNRNSITSFRDASTRQSTRSTRRRSSTRSTRRRSSTKQHNSLPQIGNARTNLTSIPSTTLGVAAAAHIRQKFSLIENISEEPTEKQKTIEQSPVTTIIEPEERSKHPSFLSDEPISNPNISSLSLSSFPYYSIPSTKIHQSYHDRQKDYRLSDLVMFGPEYFSHVFNLPRQRKSKIDEKLTELDRIKQDLFHRYLWTKNPQVSSRIRSLPTFTRNSTFII